MKSIGEALLVINAGSSSIKFAVFSVDGEQLLRQLHGNIERIGAETTLHLTRRNGEQHQQAVNAVDHREALQLILGLLEQQSSPQRIIAVGHRVVHGGELFQQPVLITDTVVQQLRALIPLAPLHQPHHLSAIHALQQLDPQLPQVACFDTAFHHTLPLPARQYAIPRRLIDQGIRRYGFHGLSYQYLTEQLPHYLGEQAAGRIVIAHLGNGASLCAIRDGRSVATTMGFTPLDGLPMGTRCGTIDPGVLLYLLQQEKMDGEQLSQLLYLESGLLGLSGISSDMRELLASRTVEAGEAIYYFVHRCCVEIGGLTAALGGLDALVFSGGIGEHAATIRAAIVERLSWLGLELDPVANANNQRCISPPQSRVTSWVIPTDEELMIARQTHTVTKSR